MVCPTCEHEIGVHESSGCTHITRDFLIDYAKRCECALTRDAVIERVRTHSESEAGAAQSDAAGSRSKS